MPPKIIRRQGNQRDNKQEASKDHQKPEDIQANAIGFCFVGLNKRFVGRQVINLLFE